MSDICAGSVVTDTGVRDIDMERIGSLEARPSPTDQASHADFNWTMTLNSS